MCICLRNLKMRQIPINSTHRHSTYTKHVMKAYEGSGRISPLILSLGTRWRWGVRLKLWPLYHREKSPITHWIGGRTTPRASGSFAERSKISSTSVEPITVPRFPVHNLETISSMLFRLLVSLYASSKCKYNWRFDKWFNLHNISFRQRLHAIPFIGFVLFLLFVQRY